MSEKEKIAEGLEAGTSDEKKFSSLYLLSKVLDKEKEEDLNFLFQKMNFKFLDRLLKQGMNKDLDNESEEYVKDKTMNDLGINVISHLYSLENQFNSDILLARIPLLLNHLVKKNHEDLLLDIFYKLSLDLKSSLYVIKGRPLFENSLMKKLIDYGHELIIKKDSKKDKWVTLISNFGKTLLNQENEKEYQVVINEFLKYIAVQLDGVDVEHKLDYMSVIIDCLQDCNTKVLKYYLNNNSYDFSQLRNNVYLLLNSRHSTEYKDKAIILSNILIRHFSFEWLKDEKKIAMFLVRMSAIEVRTLLEVIQYDSYDNQPFFSSLEILGHMTQFLSLEDFTTIIEIDTSNIVQLITWLRESYLDLLYFLTDHVEFKDSTHHPLLLRLANDICQYLIEDSYLLENEVFNNQTIPLNKFFNYLVIVLKSYEDNLIAKSCEMIVKVSEVILMTNSIPTQNFEEVILNSIDDLIPTLVEHLNSSFSGVKLDSNSTQFIQLINENYPIIDALELIFQLIESNNYTEYNCEDANLDFYKQIVKVYKSLDI
ncbi:hypothetical protein K502DRAFT_350062 [Neoconidiobolus thromboides FSU 785]|nr:hypothetical protein K502DRAFT_350062 [Neoconidiobolus thromboides FSU 785]